MYILTTSLSALKTDQPQYSLHLVLPFAELVHRRFNSTSEVFAPEKQLCLTEMFAKF